MKRIIYLLLFILVGSFQKAYTQENKTAKTSDLEKFYKFLGENIKYPEKARLVDAQGNSLILLTISDGTLKKFTVTNANPELGFDEEVTQKLFAYKDFSKLQSGNYALVTSYRIADSKSPVKNENYLIPKGYSELKLVIMGFGMNKVGAIDTAQANPKSKNGFKVNFTRGSLQNSEGKHPLVILNDDVIEYDFMKNIDPNSIQSVSVLKDAASILKYGEEGRNGVIIILTKDYTPKKTVK
ncbi:hypothetical protein EZ428_01295 [Pedobacter frigiditerrae]|uniref:TonB-dependent outer membrane receptor, SusC/RagA subfamily, signature region n=1 Tax=Pedobacter frigiditerrae TaxID=2530452 RepID=A0A4V2MJ92_9SPHI|nr:hypothetical protein [Pedobacter frigiditerrae]TCC93436.1 hypothetical protein EZ428_01295 [Pedobacter frigiditerrae]